MLDECLKETDLVIIGADFVTEANLSVLGHFEISVNPYEGRKPSFYLDDDP